MFSDEKCAAFLQYFGLAVLIYYSLNAILRIYNNVGTFFLGIGKVDLKKYGSWAVVTGCTDGIGKAYAEALAKKGLNVVLISRTLAKLEEQAKYLTEKYKVQTKVIAVDFTDSHSIYPTIGQYISDLDVAILVNNVGIGYKYPEFFAIWAEDPKVVEDLINCNIMSVTKMSAIVLPGMIKRKGGVIINNGSSSGRVPTPLLAVYSATKAYVDFFSRCLSIEYKSKGIIVQSLCPYFVSTKLSAVRKNLFVPLPDEYVSEALTTIGSQSVSNGSLIHSIQGWLFESALPRCLVNHISFTHLVAANKRALAKLSKRQAATDKKE